MPAHGGSIAATPMQRITVRARSPGASVRCVRCASSTRFRDFERADALLKEALELDGTSAWLWVEHAWCMERADRYAAALESARRAFDL